MTDEKDEEKKSEAVTSPDEKEVVEEKKEAAAPPEKKTEKKVAEKKKKAKDPADAYRLPPSNPVSGAWKTMLGFGVLGVGGALYGYSQNPVRFAYSWMFGFACVLSLVVGAILLVLMHHMANAHWGVVVRRVAEVFGATSWMLVILFLPILVPKVTSTLFGQFLSPEEHTAKEHAAWVDPQSPTDVEYAANDFHQPRGMPHGFPHGPTRFQPRQGADARPSVHGTSIHVRSGNDAVEARAERAEHAEVMASKNWYLNKGFFYGRMVFYFLVWFLIGGALLRWSLEQDRTKDPMITVKLARFSPPAVILMAISLTFAAFDWIMALDPGWYSTIFGVTFFAGSMVCIFAMLILVFLGFRQSGVLVKEVTVEHYHDLGKLLFGFMCFWAYVCFAQFFLIWYAAIPEETIFFHHRWDVGPWKNISLILIFFHFIFPFIYIMSRNVKRNLTLLRVGAWLLIAMHVIDIYWLVMPNVPHQTSFTFTYIDVFGFMGPVALFLAAAFYRLRTLPILPVGDPRLQRSIHFLNA